MSRYICYVSTSKFLMFWKDTIFRTHFDSSLWLYKYNEHAVLIYYQYVLPLKIVNTDS